MLLALLASFASQSPTSTAPTAPTAPAREWIEGRIAYKLREGASGAAIRELGDPASHQPIFLPARRSDAVGLARWFSCAVAPGSEDAAVAHLRAAPEIEWAERVNGGLAIAGNPPQPPSDPNYAQQWCLSQANDVDMDVPEAWTLRGTYSADPSVLVGVVDTGYDTQFANPDFAGVIWTNPGELANGVDDDGNGLVDDLHAWDFVNNDAVPHSDHPHGTQTSSVIAARTDNAFGIAGVASGVQVVPVKAFDAGGFYPCCGPWAGAISGAVSLQYCVDAGCAIINNSWTNATSPFQAQQDAVQYALDNGVHVVFAAGNASTNVAWPPMTEGVIAVAGIDANGVRSNWGFQSSNYGTWVELSAGGTAVSVDTNGGATTQSNGTSFACPNVVGVAVLALSEAPKLSTDDLIDVLKEGAVSVDAQNPGFIGQLGAGHANALFSLRLLKPVADLGAAFGGAKLPVLNGWGSFGVGKSFSVSVSRAHTDSAGALVVGFGAANLPLFGGVLVPSADFLLPFGTGPKGAAKKVFTFTSALPTGTALRAQAGVLDPTAPQGVALTNALLLSVP